MSAIFARLVSVWFEHKRMVLAGLAVLFLLFFAIWYFINPFLSWLSAFWYRNLRTILACIALMLIVGTAAYLYYEERRLRRLLNDLIPERRLPYLLHQWKLRNFQVIFALVIASTLFLSTLPNGKGRHKKAPETLLTQIAQDIAGETELVDTAEIGEEAEEPADAPPADQLLAPPTDPSAVLDLFETGVLNPSELSLDAIKARHENALVGGYILRNCNRTNDTDIEVLLRAIRTDILNFQSDPAHSQIDSQQLYAAIVSASKGSYEMIYSRSDCNTPQIDMLEEQFTTYIEHYRANEKPE